MEDGDAVTAGEEFIDDGGAEVASAAKEEGVHGGMISVNSRKCLFAQCGDVASF